MGRGDAGLERGTLEVAGVRRGYWLAQGTGDTGTLSGRREATARTAAGI